MRPSDLEHGLCLAAVSRLEFRLSNVDLEAMGRDAFPEAGLLQRTGEGRTLCGLRAAGNVRKGTPRLFPNDAITVVKEIVAHGLPMVVADHNPAWHPKLQN